MIQWQLNEIQQIEEHFPFNQNFARFLNLQQSRKL